MNKIGIFVHSRYPAAGRLAEDVRRFLVGRVAEVWQTTTWDDGAIEGKIPGTELLISLGGDGTVL
ncbi:MAG: hypothetical protein ACRD2A_18195, partial [Vicinamibacterales bacterium]